MENNEIKVSVLCIAYNHEKYIRKCLDGFVMQKTNFKFEVIVHDDASTDNTKQIIEEYNQKYPEIFVPIYETENQFSKKIAIIDDIMFPVSKGKYIAMCEGDDYWCDENKLQMQYDFMESHPECSACFTNTVIHDIKNKVADFNYNNWTDVHELTEKEVFELGLVHTTTHFVRREALRKDKEDSKYWFGDYVRKTSYYKFGKLYCLPYVTSVYNSNNDFGLTNMFYKNDSPKVIYEKLILVPEYLKNYNKKTGNKFLKANKKIIKSTLESLPPQLKNCLLKGKELSRKNYYYVNRELLKNEYYKKVLEKADFKLRVKLYLKYHCPYFIYKLIKKLK